MSVRQLFATQLYQAQLGDPALLAELNAACLRMALDDKAGRAWARAHGYPGYTSYASLDDLPRRDPAFAALRRLLDRHIARFAEAVGFALAKPLRLDSIWANLINPGGTHAGHLHPHSVVSGTLYVSVPPGSGALRLEDPRLPLMMAAPVRPHTFVTVEPDAGDVLLWESWLRHEVTPHRSKGKRISISFNYS